MSTEAGEFAVGAYLERKNGCEIVTYNVKPQENGRGGQAEFDVVGFDLENNEAYLCEVATHLEGLLYGNGCTDTIRKVTEKYERQKAYAKKYLKSFNKIHYMFWSPIVGPTVKAGLEVLEKDGLEHVINDVYTEKIRELFKLAEDETRDTGNPYFRTLQILTHLRYNKELLLPKLVLSQKDIRH